MRQIFIATCLVGLVAFTANAYTLPREESSIDAVFGTAAQEAVYLGEILRDVAQTLDDDDQLNAENEEYFIRDMWNKTKEAVKNAVRKMKVSVKGVYKETKDNLKQAAKNAKDKLKEKAAEIVSDLLKQVSGGYSMDETASYVNFRKVLLNLIRRTAERLIKVGMGLGQPQHTLK